MRLKYQLLITLLVSNGVLIATLYAYNNWSFNRGFLNYINDSEIESLQPLVANLSSGYAEPENWEWLTQNRELWARFVSDSMGNTRGRPRNNRDPRQPPPSNRARRLVLADANRQVLVGRVDDEHSVKWLPIKHLDSIVGYVGFRTSRQLSGQLDNVFAAQQKRSFAIASLIMIALSALLAAILSSRLVRPVLSVSDAVSKISKGKYDHRVKSDRKDELGDLSRDINQLAYALEHSRTARREWIAELSHELRTPVAVLQSEVEAIEDGIRPLNMLAINSLHSETLRLSHLINDLHILSLSDIGALEYNMAPLNLLLLIEERTNAVTAMRMEKRIAVHIDAPLSEYIINGDQQRLGQLLDNLVQNSMRYTDEGGQIQIELSQDDQYLQLIWQDSTPGLTDQQLPQLFDPLFRAEESRNRTQGGSGLGLTITQKIVEAHQGTISASHSSLGGLAITLRLPNLHQSAAHNL